MEFGLRLLSSIIDARNAQLRTSICLMQSMFRNALSPASSKVRADAAKLKLVISGQITLDRLGADKIRDRNFLTTLDVLTLANQIV